MKKVPFKKIDAFATENSSGNPAALVNLDESGPLSEAEMLQLAKELQGFVSEVAYIKELDTHRFALRYFSSEREVAFCGHATIATMYDLFTSREDLQAVESVTIEVQSGPLTVENRIQSENAVFIHAPTPTYSDTTIDSEALVEALGMSESYLDKSRSCSIINAGLETLIVPISGLHEILSVEPELTTLKQYCFSIGVDIIILAAQEVEFDKNDLRTRVFAPTFGYLEDPATGSGNAALAYDLLRNGWDGALLSIEQNDSARSPNRIKIYATGDVNNQQVIFGGGALVRINGDYFLRNTNSSE